MSIDSTTLTARFMNKLIDVNCQRHVAELCIACWSDGNIGPRVLGCL